MIPFPKARGGFWSGEDQMPPARGRWFRHSELWEHWSDFEDRGYRPRFLWFNETSMNPLNSAEKGQGDDRLYGLMPGIFWTEQQRQQLDL